MLRRLEAWLKNTRDGCTEGQRDGSKIGGSVLDLVDAGL
jgi:hypothetical protein